jgi:hypothetical protein
MSRAFLFAGLTVGSLALADVAPPDLSGCQGRDAGAACQRDDGSAGTCTRQTCTRNDYSEGPPPKVVEYECLQCKATGPVPPNPDEKKGSCSTAPGLGLVALGAWLRRRRS